MNRKIHEIYDVVMKIIIIVYNDEFLRYIGIEEHIKNILSVEFTTITGRKLYLDFLCELSNGKLLHVEFQFPKVNKKDLNRFFNYNITAQVRHEKTTDTVVIDFISKSNELSIKIGDSKSFTPSYYHLGNIDTKEFFENIEIKLKSNRKLTSFEEITLMIIPLIPENTNKLKLLERISKILKNENLFDERKYEFIKYVVKLEIENLLTTNERKQLVEDIKMTPEAKEIITGVIQEVNRKTLYEAEEKGIEKGIREGKKAGKKEEKENIARKLKNTLDTKEISEIIGLSENEIEKL